LSPATLRTCSADTPFDFAQGRFCPRHCPNQMSIIYRHAGRILGQWISITDVCGEGDPGCDCGSRNGRGIPPRVRLFDQTSFFCWCDVHPVNRSPNVLDGSKWISSLNGKRPPRLPVGNYDFKLGVRNLTTVRSYPADHRRAVNSATISSFEAGNHVVDILKWARTYYAESVAAFHFSWPADTVDIVNFEHDVFVLERELSSIWVDRVQGNVRFDRKMGAKYRVDSNDSC
jgi:hypothetical protein